MSKLIPYGRNHNLPFAGGLFDDRFLRSFFDFGDFFGSSAFRVDVKDKGDHYELEAELPGIPEDQIEVTVDGGTLTISANMNMEKKEEKQDYIYSERRMGRFQRSFDLDGIKEDGITASYKNGVLTLNMPKLNETKAPNRRRIDIN